MPPRKQQQRGAPPSAPQDDRDDEDRGQASRGYRTGNEYPAQDGGEPRPGDDSSPDLGDRDIYGEDDPLPDEGEGEAGAEPAEENPDATRAGPPRKLVVVAGPDKGKVKRFGGVRLVVGRTSACNVHLSDNSVSRRHLELVQGSNGVLLRDLGSGNGTKVNGERTNEKLLKHEDVIEIGQTKLQFVDEAEAIRLMREEAERREEEEKRKAEEEEARKKAEEEAAAQAKAEAEAKAAEAAANPPAAEAPSEGAAPESDADAAEPASGSGRKGLDWRARVGLGIAGGAVLFVMFLVIPQLFRTPPPPPPPAKQVAAAKKMDLAKKAIEEERFEDALALAESADRMWPGSDTEGYATRARGELAALKLLGEARGFLEQQRFEDARAALAQVPDVSPKRTEERHKLEAELDAKQVEYLVKTVNEALDALDVESAKQLIDRLPDARRAEFQARLTGAQKELSLQEARDQKASRAAIEAAAARRKAERQARIVGALKSVDRKLNSGEYDRATLECDRVLDASPEGDVRERAMEIKQLIPAFARALEEGERKYNAHSLESAVRPLKKARDLYRKIGLPGAVGAKLDDELLESMLAGGKAAMLRNDYSSSAVLYREALALSPGDENARAGLDRIAQRADDLYMEAYMIRDRDPKESIAKLKLVLDVAPKGSGAYEKAKAQLAKVQP